QDSPMYVRIVSAKIQPGKMEEFRNLYSTEIIPALRETPGCRYAFLTENLQEENEIISVTIWDSKEDAQYYEESGRFEELTKKVAHTLSSLYQWKMALQKKTGERVKTSDDLKVTHYNVVTGKKFD
ncbi:MAG: antibiotic biosynthesis monooxygenase family protein, partial [Calditrichia bacterium]